jgi:predicted enzyme related to lactoylglutathione lyase
MINGAHAIVYGDAADAAVTARRAEGIEVARPVTDEGWGLLTAITLPGGVEFGLYQPRHPTGPSRPERG